MNRTYTARAYGRVNLIGEHTDYNGGWVLPTALPQFTEVTLEKRSDLLVKLTTYVDHNRKKEFTYQLGSEQKIGSWGDYLQGATSFLREKLQKTSLLTGFEAQIHSRIPQGSGLSSSAALEISFLKALREAFGFDLNDTDLALLGQKIENDFVGARVGIMDQMACCLANFGEALFLDTKTLSYERIPLPLDKMDLMVINSGISHRLSSTGGYNQRRMECEEASHILKVEQLRDLGSDLSRLEDLPPVLKKRARHVVTENQRVFKAVEAIKEGNLRRLGELFVESHTSMRDDYEVSLPEIDKLVELCLQHPKVYGARLTGGGFGGSIVAIAVKGAGSEISQIVAEEYQKQTKEKATVLV